MSCHRHFPVMNPCLERALAWESFHPGFISAAHFQIAAQLPTEYAVQIENRHYIHEPPPDRRFLGHPDLGGVRAPNSDGVLAILESAPAYVTILDTIDIETVGYLAIRDRDGNDLIAVIELLGPTNKYAGPDRE